MSHARRISRNDFQLASSDRIHSWQRYRRPDRLDLLSARVRGEASEAEPMTVAELIEKLKEMDQSLPVLRFNSTAGITEYEIGPLQRRVQSSAPGRFRIAPSAAEGQPAVIL